MIMKRLKLSTNNNFKYLKDLYMNTLINNIYNINYGY